jgi:5-deoxy-D-glucuronate isomerase
MSSDAFSLHGRDDVFSAVTDFLHVPRVEVASSGGGRFGLSSSRADRRLEARYVAAHDVPVEVRDAGGAGREIDVTAEVRSGDAIVMPHGYHGPSMAAPGCDLHYLNVMAGPGERAWRFTDGPAHAWIRDSWTGQPVDRRPPLTAGGRNT